MDTSQPQNRSLAPQTIPEALARLVRHEVGDLLQTIYATAAILKERLPPDCRLERKILLDMRQRAENCKNLLDIVHDLYCPLILEPILIEQEELASKMVAEVAPRFPERLLRLEATVVPVVRADPKRMAQAAQILLTEACQAGQREVIFRVAAGPKTGQVEWTVLDDGPGVSVDLLERVASGLNTTPHGYLGPGIVLVRRIVELHGGQFSKGNRAEGGFYIRLIWPVQPRNSDAVKKEP